VRRVLSGSCTISSSSSDRRRSGASTLSELRRNRTTRNIGFARNPPRSLRSS
jgi:hypothetical protein